MPRYDLPYTPPKPYADIENYSTGNAAVFMQQAYNQILPGVWEYADNFGINVNKVYAMRPGEAPQKMRFDPNTIIDRATFVDPDQRAEGLDYVIVGGKIAAVNAVSTGELGGTMLYREV